VTGTTLKNVQAHLLRPAHRELTQMSLWFLTIKDPSEVRSLVRWLLKQDYVVSDAEAHSRRHGGGTVSHRHVAVGFTAKGLKKLGWRYHPDPIQRPLNEKDPFCKGMRARARLLGDPPAEWPTKDKPPPDMLVWVATTQEDSDAGLDDLTAALRGFKHHVESGSYRADQPVLGFLDGTSQPFVSELMPSLDRLPGGGTVTRDGWSPVPLGEFVLGCADAGGERVLPKPAKITEGGTFLVYRRYAFNQDAFDKVLADGASRGLGSEGDVAAKIMGRYPDKKTPDDWPPDYDALIPPDRANGREPSRNDFRYADDSYGYSCPLGAHIRRANPRDALGFEGRLTERHRIIRRGIPWKEDGRQGLHFIAINARIHDQFEFIQRQWLNTGSSFRLGDDIDLVAGSRPKGATELPFVVQGPRPVVIRAPGPLAKFEGGDYFLMPGMEGLRRLAKEPR
jgi:deferrochelatase/peroxidase EfeB